MFDAEAEQAAPGAKPQLLLLVLVLLLPPLHMLLRSRHLPPLLLLLMLLLLLLLLLVLSMVSLEKENMAEESAASRGYHDGSGRHYED